MHEMAGVRWPSSCPDSGGPSDLSQPCHSPWSFLLRASRSGGATAVRPATRTPAIRASRKGNAMLESGREPQPLAATAVSFHAFPALGGPASATEPGPEPRAARDGTDTRLT